MCYLNVQCVLNFLIDSFKAVCKWVVLSPFYKWRSVLWWRTRIPDNGVLSRATPGPLSVKGDAFPWKQDRYHCLAIPTFDPHNILHFLKLSSIFWQSLNENVFSFVTSGNMWHHLGNNVLLHFKTAPLMAFPVSKCEWLSPANFRRFWGNAICTRVRLTDRWELPFPLQRCSPRLRPGRASLTCSIWPWAAVLRGEEHPPEGSNLGGFHLVPNH